GPGASVLLDHGGWRAPLDHTEAPGMRHGRPVGRRPATRKNQHFERLLEGRTGGHEHERAVGEERRVERRKGAVVPARVAREVLTRELATGNLRERRREALYPDTGRPAGGRRQLRRVPPVDQDDARAVSDE